MVYIEKYSLPLFVKVAGVRYDVTFDDSVEDAFMCETNFEKLKITIGGDDLKEDRKVNLFLMSVMYAILFEIAKHDLRNGKFVKRIASAFTQIFFDNGWHFNNNEEGLLKLPTKVKILGTIYDVKFDPHLNERKSQYGECRYGKQELVIDSSLNPLRMINAFFHELMHAVLYEIGEFDLKDDEDFIEPFANMFTQVFLDNNFGFGEDCYELK